MVYKGRLKAFQTAFAKLKALIAVQVMPIQKMSLLPRLALNTEK